MAQTPAKPRRRKPAAPVGLTIPQRARRDARFAVEPQLADLARQETQAQQDYERAVGQTGAAYAGLQNTLAPLGGQYQQQVKGISSDLQSQLAGLQSGFSPTADPGNFAAGVPAGAEYGAASGLGATLGAGGLEQLASQRARNVGYQTSAVRQAAIEPVVAQRNYLSSLQQTLDSLRGQRSDLSSQQNDLYLERVDALRQQAIQNRATLSGIKGQNALNQFLQSQIGDLLGGGGGGGGGGLGGGGPVVAPAPRRRTQPEPTNQSAPVTPGTPTAPPGAKSASPKSVVNDFIGGDLPWAKMSRRQRQKVRSRITQAVTSGDWLKYWKKQGLPELYIEPRTGLTPQAVIDYIRQNIYGYGNKPTRRRAPGKAPSTKSSRGLPGAFDPTKYKGF